MTPRLTRSALSATLAMVCGCSSLYIHSETRQKQAEATTKAWTEIEQESLFKLERENLTKLAQAEAQTQQRLAAAKREYLAAVITGPSPANEKLTDVALRSVRSVVLERTKRKLVRVTRVVAPNALGTLPSYVRLVSPGRDDSSAGSSLAYKPWRSGSG